MRKTFDSCAAALLGYAAIRAFGQDDYAGVYFHGLAASFAAADLLKASLGKKDFINPDDFQTPSAALIIGTTAGAVAYAWKTGEADLQNSTDTMLKYACYYVTAVGGFKFFRTRNSKSHNELNLVESSDVDQAGAPAPK